MIILIDADGCPVVDLTLQIAKQFGVPVIILCDTSHQIEREGAQTMVFDKGIDSVDFALVNRVKPGDVVVTQDYGLASMCLAKCARVLNQNGLEYTADNIDALMLRRYENKKLLRAGKHPKGSPKRTKEQDVRFADTLEKILSKNYDTFFWKAGEIQSSFFISSNRDFFVNFRRCGCILAFQLGSYMKASFLANIDSRDYILVTSYKLWVQNGLFRRLPIRGMIFQKP